jgi:chorismate mutase
MEDLREKINSCDKTIINLLAERRELSMEVVKEKGFEWKSNKGCGTREDIIAKLY